MSDLLTDALTTVKGKRKVSSKRDPEAFRAALFLRFGYVAPVGGSPQRGAPA